MGQEIIATPQNMMRTRLNYSVTGRGWDFESTVEITGPMPAKPHEMEAILSTIKQAQIELRAQGAEERDHRNARDGKAGAS